MKELGIVEIREIIRTIRELYRYDFSTFALTSLKHRLEKIIIKSNLNSAESFIRKLQDNPEYFDVFLHEIMVPSTEMFRDPSLWRWLREEHFLNLSESALLNYKIWLPVAISGGELFSLTILLKELGLLEKVKIIVSCLSEKSIQQIREGIYELKKIEVSAENYKRFQGEGQFGSYYKVDRYFAIRDISLINNVEFRKQNINFDDSPRNIKLILFRNSLIYFNPTLQEKVLKTMHENLSASGLFILGAQERIKQDSIPKDFTVVNDSESVYKKKI